MKMQAYADFFLKEKFVCGEKLSLADYKVAPFFYALEHPSLKATCDLEAGARPGSRSDGLRSHSLRSRPPYRRHLEGRLRPQNSAKEVRLCSGVFPCFPSGGVERFVQKVPRIASASTARES